MLIGELGWTSFVKKGVGKKERRAMSLKPQLLGDVYFFRTYQYVGFLGYPVLGVDQKRVT